MKLLVLAGLVLTGLALVVPSVPVNEGSLTDLENLGTAACSTVSQVKASKMCNDAPVVNAKSQGTTTKECSRAGASVLSCKSGSCSEDHLCIWPSTCCDTGLDQEVGCFCKVDTGGPLLRQRDDDTVNTTIGLPPHRKECFLDRTGYYLCMGGFCAPYEYCAPQGKVCAETKKGVMCVRPSFAAARLQAGCALDCRCGCRGIQGAMFCPCTEDIPSRSIDTSYEDMQASTEIAKRGSLPPHWMTCFEDRAGYYLCMKGFCAPYEYCAPKGLECFETNQGAKCLPPNTKASSPDAFIEVENSMIRIPPLAFFLNATDFISIPVDDDAQMSQNIPDSTQPEGCAEGETHCGIDPRDNSWYILQCVQGGWEVSQTCPAGQSCSQIKGQTPQCIANTLHTRASDEELFPSEALDSVQMLAKRNSLQQSSCNPGTYSCGGAVMEILSVCDSLGHWTRSAICGTKNNWGCCVIGSTPGTAYCNCNASKPPPPKQDPPPHIIVATGQESKPVSERRDKLPPVAPGPCKPGTYMCDPVQSIPSVQEPKAIAERKESSPSGHICKPGTYRCDSYQKFLWICQSDGNGVLLSAICGNVGCCKNGPHGTAFCIC